VFTVLVVEALEMFSDALALALDRIPGLSVLDERPTNGPAAVEAIARLKPDVALVDYWMPGMEGPALAGTALTQAPKCKIVFLLWLVGPVEVQQALATGAAGFISKNSTLEELTSALKRIAGGEAPYFDPRLDPLLKGGIESDRGDLKRFQSLTPRQVEILALLDQGLSTNQIASRLQISPKNVRNHISAILAKTGSRSSGEALFRARSCGFISR